MDSELQYTINEQVNQISRLERELRMTKSNLQDKTYECDDLERKVSNLEREVSDLKRTKDDLEYQVRGLQSDLEYARRDHY